MIYVKIFYGDYNHRAIRVIRVIGAIMAVGL